MARKSLSCATLPTIISDVFPPKVFWATKAMWARATDEERLGVALIAVDTERSLEDEIPHGLVACKKYFEYHSVVVTRPVLTYVTYEDLLNFGLLPTEETRE